MSKLLDAINKASDERTCSELSLGFVRYEYVRRLTPYTFDKIWMRSMEERRPFDDIIDEMIEREAK